MKIKYFFIIALIILMISTVILTYYRKNKISVYIEGFYVSDRCKKHNNCKNCLNTGECAWTQNNICISIPENSTGLLLNKSDCPLDTVSPAESSSESVPAPTSDDNPNLASTQITSSNQDLSVQNDQTIQGVQGVQGVQREISQINSEAETANKAADAADKSAAALHRIPAIINKSSKPINLTNTQNKSLTQSAKKK
jgi:hypothetical protein